MTNTARKHIWSVPLVASIAIIGMLAAFLVLANNPGVAMAQGGDPCAGLTDDERADFLLGGGTCGEPTAPPTATVPTAPASASALEIDLTYSMGAVTVSWMAVTGATEYLVQYRQCTADDCAGDFSSQTVVGTMHTIAATDLDIKQSHQIVVTASGADDTVLSQSPPGMVCPAAAPTGLKVEALDNAARLSWKDPVDPIHIIEVMGFQIERVTYLQDSNNPILVNNRMATIDLGEPVNQHWDLGLSYGVTYTYRVRAEVQITDAAGSRMMGYSLWSDPETVIVADSGGRLTPLEEAPDAVRNLKADPACADTITVTWAAPADMGIVAARRDKNGVYVGPDFIGGEGAGKVEQGEKATSVTYQVQRMVNNGPWMSVEHDGMMYIDKKVDYAEAGAAPNTYKYRVRAMNEAKLYGPWMMVSETLGQMPMMAQVPTSPDADPDDQGNVLFTWDPPGTAAGTAYWRNIEDVTDEDGNLNRWNLSDSMVYIVQRQSSPGGEWITLSDNWGNRLVPGDGDTQLDGGRHQYLESATTPQDALANVQTQRYEDAPPAGGTYKYRVSARAAMCARSAWVVTAEEVTVVVVPGKPTGLSAMASGSSTINLSWTAPALTGRGPITEYRVEYAEGSGTWKDLAKTRDDATTYSHTGLKSATTYHYRVYAVNANGESAPSDAAMAMTGRVEPLGNPTGLSLMSSSAGVIQATWSPATNATVHWVWSVNADGTGGKYTEAAGNAGMATISGLQSGASYWVIVIAGQQSAGSDTTTWSQWSGWQSATAQ